MKMSNCHRSAPPMGVHSCGRQQDITSGCQDQNDRSTCSKIDSIIESKRESCQLTNTEMTSRGRSTWFRQQSGPINGRIKRRTSQRCTSRGAKLAGRKLIGPLSLFTGLVVVIGAILITRMEPVLGEEFTISGRQNEAANLEPQNVSGSISSLAPNPSSGQQSEVENNIDSNNNNNNMNNKQLVLHQDAAESQLQVITVSSQQGEKHQHQQHQQPQQPQQQVVGQSASQESNQLLSVINVQAEPLVGVLGAGAEAGELDRPRPATVGNGTQSGQLSRQATKSEPQQQPQQTQPKQQQQALLETMDDAISQMSTSHSVTFASPPASMDRSGTLSSDQNQAQHHQSHPGRQRHSSGSHQRVQQEQQQQHQHQQLTTTTASSQPSKRAAKLAVSTISNNNNNRWTHFGARLRPLTLTGSDSGSSATQLTSGPDHSTAGSSSRPLHLSGGLEQRGPPLRQQQALPVGSSARAGADQEDDSAFNQNNLSAGNNNNDDDDQDSEALLYKMMQQQSFLTSPVWQRTSKPELVFAAGNGEGNGGEQRSPAELANNRKVIRLLKSYSHIHQVDDSDDQIRGTQTRVSQLRRMAKQPKSGRAYQNQEDEDEDGEEDRQAGSERRTPSRGRQQSQARRRQHLLHQVSLQSSQSPIKVRGQHQNNNNAILSNRRQQQQGQQLFVSTTPISSLDRPSNHLIANSRHHHHQASDSENHNHQQEGGAGGGQPEGGAEQGEGGSGEEFECPNNGIFADEPSGCQGYHVCQSGAQVQQRFQCPLGTLFNNIILTCDFAHNVQCGKGKQALASAVQAAAALEEQQLNQGSGGSESGNEQASSPPPPPPPPPPPRPVARGPVHVDRASEDSGWPAQVHSGRAGPRQLNVGSSGQQFVRQPEFASRPTRPSVAEPARDSSADEQDDDSGPIEPLVPATLPPRPSAHRSQFPSHSQQQLHHQFPQQHQHQHQQQHQRHFGASSTSTLASANPLLSAIYDGQTSSVTPLFVGPSTPGPFGEPNPGRQFQQQSAQTGYPEVSQTPVTERANYDFVINHVPGPSHARPLSTNVVPIPVAPTTPFVPVAGPDGRHQHVTAAHRPRLQPARPPVVLVPQNNLQRQPQQPHHQQQQQQQQHHLNQHQHQQQQSHLQFQQQARYQPQASQSRPQHVEPSQHPAVVDLKKPDPKSGGNTGVSSEALNDGLLLIVRHSSGSKPLQVGVVPAGSTSAASSPDQAFAVQPTAVRPDSPIDAQLFPHVQRELAAQSQPAVSHLSPQKPHQQQRNQVNPGPRQGSTPSNQGIVVHGQLPPMEPPRPVQAGVVAQKVARSQRALAPARHQQAPVERLQSAASSDTPHQQARRAPEGVSTASPTTRASSGSTSTTTTTASSSSSSTLTSTTTTTTPASTTSAGSSARPKSATRRETGAGQQARSAATTSVSSGTTTTTTTTPKPSGPAAGQKVRRVRRLKAVSTSAPSNTTVSSTSG